ncbi:unnamed protein product [Calypogeia fissa]
MAQNQTPTANLTTERIRVAAKRLEQDSLRVQSDLNANTIFFKIVAEEMEKEHDSEAVAKLRQGLLEVLDSAHRLEYQCSALQNVSQSFTAGIEETDFSKHLDESTRQFLAANPFDPTKDKLYHQFDRAIWNIHHAGEAAPGQEEEEMVMINDTGVLNHNCPLTGKPVIELENPVRSIQCHHIYEQTAVIEYIAKAGRRRCKCAVAGCPFFLKMDNLKNDASLNMEIQELRLRDRATQLETYTEIEDLEDEVVDLKD